MALSWKAPQPISPDYRDRLRQTYVTDLGPLHTSLPPRFGRSVQLCINSIDDILTLPMVLLHRELGTRDLIVDEATCHLVGVIGWAEAEVLPFGVNLYSLQLLSGEVHPSHEPWKRYEDYDALQDTFRETFTEEVGGLSDHQVRTIKLARALGLLLEKGFTDRLTNEPRLIPITDTWEHGWNIKMMILNGPLINLETKLDF